MKAWFRNLPWYVKFPTYLFSLVFMFSIGTWLVVRYQFSEYAMFPFYILGAIGMLHLLGPAKEKSIFHK